LSGNGYLDDKTLEDILIKYPNLKCLHLLDTPQLELKTKLDLARKAKTLELWDTDLLPLPFRDNIETATPEFYSYIQPLVIQMIAPNQWSFLLITEPASQEEHEDFRGENAGRYKGYPSAARYAFLSAAPVEEDGSADETAPKTEIIRADIETFVSHVITGDGAEGTRKHILDGWKRVLDNLKPNDPEYRLELCGMEEIESYLRSECYTGLKKDGSSVV
jgi:hypothetical protein